MGSTSWTHTSTDSRKTLGSQHLCSNPILGYPGICQPGTATPSLRLHGLVRQCQLHGCPSQRCPSSLCARPAPAKPQQLGRACPTCSALLPNPTTNLSASGGKETLWSRYCNMLHGPAFCRHSISIYSPHAAAMPCAKCPCPGPRDVSAEPKRK